MAKGSLNIAGHLVAPFGRPSGAYEIVRPRPVTSCKAHDDDDMLLFKNIA